MSRPRNAVAGLALAAAGVLARRVAGIRSTPSPAAPAAPPPPTAEPDSADSAEVERARSELAEELARRARSES